MDDFENVPVPRRFVLDVYAYVTHLRESEQGQGDGERPAPTYGNRYGEFKDWSPTRLRQLHECPRQTVQRIASVLDELSKAPDNRVPLSDLAERVGLTREQLRGAFSGFTRWVKRITNSDAWPLNYRSDAGKAEDVAEETYYWVSCTTAERWLEIRRG